MAEIIQFPEPPEVGVWMCGCGCVSFFVVADGKSQRIQCEACADDQRPVLARLWDMPLIDLGHRAEVIPIEHLVDGTWRPGAE